MAARALGSCRAGGRRSKTSRGGSRGGAATLKAGPRAMGNEGCDGSLGDHRRRCPGAIPGRVLAFVTAHRSSDESRELCRRG